MKQCPICNQEYDDSYRFCGKDGGQLKEKETSPEPEPEARESDPLVGTLLENKYRLERLVGRGGMGGVYAARHVFINKPVAVKILMLEPDADPSLPDRFKQEAEASGRIRHPNIVPVNDFGQTAEGLLFMVMDYIEGFPLRELLDREGRLSPTRAVEIGTQICAAMAVAHRAEIIHRDLKPENVMIEVIDGKEAARVFDFGIAKLKDRQGLTRAGTVLGTPNYMSPEQCSQLQVDYHSDIYSLGIMLYEMLTGQVPFTAPKYQQVMVKHVIEQPKPLNEVSPSVPVAISRVVLRAISKDPAQRQQSATELADELQKALRDSQ